MTAAEPARARALPGEWPGFVAELVRRLTDLGPGESLVLEVVPAGGVSPSSYYVRFVTGSDGMRAEAVGNAFLPEPAQLRDVDAERLTKRGWQAPAAESPNFSRDWPTPVPYDEVADLAIVALRHVYGAAEPADLRTRHVRADAPEITIAPPSDATVEAVRSEVLAAIRELLGVDAHEGDERGWGPFRAGSATAYVRVYGDPPAVQVLSPLVTGVDETPELLEAVNELNANVSFAKVVTTGRDVVVSLELLGVPFSPLHLSHAFSVVAAIADDYDDQLRQRFGGRTALGDFVPPAEPTRVGGYL